MPHIHEPPSADSEHNNPNRPWLRQNDLAIAGCCSLTVLFVLTQYPRSFFGASISNAILNLCSPYTLVLACACGIAFLKKLEGIWLNLFIVISIWGFFFFFYGPLVEEFKIGGDDLCQIAYWKILFRPHLAGGIGSAFTKPGQVVILGITHELAAWGVPLVFPAMLAMIVSVSLFFLVKISMDIGGRPAGALTYLVGCTYYVWDFLTASSTLFFVSCLMGGLWLFFYRPRYRTAGLILLCLALLFRIEGVAVLALVGLDRIIRREWRDSCRIAAAGVITLLIWVGFIVRVQGSLARLNSGAAAGYIDTINVDKLEYLQDAVRAAWNILQVRSLVFLLVPGLIGSWLYGRHFLYSFGFLVILVLNVVFLHGTLNLDRYTSPMYAFALSLGVGSVVSFLRLVKNHGSYTGIFLSSASCVLWLMTLNFGSYHFYKTATMRVFSNSVFASFNLMNSSKLPPSSRLMTEDDLLYIALVAFPDRFAGLESLQHFNVLDDSGRRQKLKKLDYLYVITSGGYYLDYLPIHSWEKDPFRLAIKRVLKSREPVEIYGRKLTPVVFGKDGVLFKIEPLPSTD